MMIQAGWARLAPTAVLLHPPDDIVKHGLPNAHFPSDHVSLVCDFAINS